MLNLCLVVITSHFSETKEREIAKMKLYRLQHSSSVSTGSQLMGSKSKSLYSQIIGFISHYYRRSKRLVIAQYNAYRARKDETSSNRNSANTNGYGWYKINQGHIQKLVDHQYFHNFILMAILINTLSMGIEYHEQVMDY